MEETQTPVSPKPKKGLSWLVVLIIILVLVVVYFALAQKGTPPTSPATEGGTTNEIIPPVPEGGTLPGEIPSAPEDLGL